MILPWDDAGVGQVFWRYEEGDVGELAKEEPAFDSGRSK